MLALLLYGMAGCVAVGAASRIIFLLIFRQPIVARLRGTDLSEAQRCYNNNIFTSTHSHHAPPKGFGSNFVLARVSYEVGGREYVADVKIMTPTDQQPNAAPVVWFNPNEPLTVTGLGWA